MRGREHFWKYTVSDEEVRNLRGGDVPVEVEVMGSSAVLEVEVEVLRELLETFGDRFAWERIESEVATASVILTIPISTFARASQTSILTSNVTLLGSR